MKNKRPASTMETPQINHIFTILSVSQSALTTTEFYADIARRLSNLAGKETPWGWRYIQGIHAGTIQPGKKISAAINLLYIKLEGIEIQTIQQSEQVTIKAAAGAVAPGAWILGKSRPCEEPTCTIIFVPRVPWQKYCPIHRNKKRRS